MQYCGFLFVYYIPYTDTSIFRSPYSIFGILIFQILSYEVNDNIDIRKSLKILLNISNDLIERVVKHWWYNIGQVQ
jgi:hypothetical protein